MKRVTHEKDPIALKGHEFFTLFLKASVIT